MYYHSDYDANTTLENANVLNLLSQYQQSGRSLIVTDVTNTPRWDQWLKVLGMSDNDITDCNEDLAILSNLSSVRREIEKCAYTDHLGLPRSIESLEDESFAELLAYVCEEEYLNTLMYNAFVGTQEDDAEKESTEPIDNILDNDDVADDVDAAAAADAEAEPLERLPLPGNPKHERERKRLWLALPRRARIAIRRTHRNLRHLPKGALIDMLRAAKAPRDYIDAAKSFRCESCELVKAPPLSHKSGRPKPYVFNNEVGVDVLDLHDADGNSHLFLNIVDQGT